jgi:outer membrane protein TolC
MALQNNAAVKNKLLDVKASEEVKKAAFTKYFPQVEATALTFKVDKPLLEMEIPGGNLPVYDGNPANLLTATQFAYFPGGSISMLENGTIGFATATQPLFAGRRISTGNKLANLGIEVSQLQLKTTENEIALETEKQFWQIVALNEKLKTLERYIALVDTLHKEVNDAWQAGLITRNDLLKVELKQNELKMNKLKLTNGIMLAKMALCQYIGVVYSPDVDFSDNLANIQSPDQVYVDHQSALANRAEYQLRKKAPWPKIPDKDAAWRIPAASWCWGWCPISRYHGWRRDQLRDGFRNGEYPDFRLVGSIAQNEGTPPERRAEPEPGGR